MDAGHLGASWGALFAFVNGTSKEQKTNPRQF